ncbi:short-chain dehydrogenase [Sinorhizobium fredii USDA 205]|uniref:SDR family NAD(P)-dependent oxidoreductase n=1 Tax=Rhizobium fredii TaxID=380 RepID=A0A844A8X5_RHIFR|nr:oxidoreductase [Sinorhizobium fredii]ASY73330.1 3-oxoacyl-[acyl-carrier protein] reductase [Sinorhizobium fredii CCBAU 83666]AWM27613.1 3-oxoacyl-[acyl-carrier protein] reductase [Sinorhizobium fredii CCBAU 25509]KSV83728.1 short-chain dehydrogenase [Sinorhizobium fredii USDA 205]MQW96601.1 SDR family NAD(P)-dependent oxidoreductase [Sinorhizobium fredii]MQX09569.1 SDR family NAD(P)-dependent oxidoreductase [Sinorhizobium fredii]
MKVWFITGASRGFGALMTKGALAAGDAVVATARNPSAVIEQIGDNSNLLAVALDVTNEAQAKEAAAKAIERFGRIDVLVNNAGYGLLGAVEEATAEEIEKLYATNVFGVLKVTRAVLPYMRRQRSGHVLNFSSIGGYFGYPGWGVYGSTKFAVEGLSESLSAELEPFGIKVTIIEPGFFRTDFLADNSLSVSAAAIPDYIGTPAGNMRDFAADANHAQPGNPAKLAAGIVTLVNSAKPPLRMPFGSDTVAVIEEQNASVARELAEWRELALSTDFPKNGIAV